MEAFGSIVPITPGQFLTSKPVKMKLSFFTGRVMLPAAVVLAVGVAAVTSGPGQVQRNVIGCCANPSPHHVCVMKTILGLDTAHQNSFPGAFKTPEEVKRSLERGLSWIDKAQAPDGGWGAGSHNAQHIKDPHAVTSDPATSALVAMSLLRTENTLVTGSYSKNLAKVTEFLLKSVENTPKDQPYITHLTGTQPQVKLGRNIDVILTSQFFTNLLRYEIKDEALKKRIERALDICISRIQKSQSSDGSWKEGGWAPVVQSALANNALENAQDLGREVDTVVLRRGYDYQNRNFNLETKSAVTGDAAGVMLYGLSSTTRSSAKESKKAEDLVRRARRDGRIRDEKVTEENLVAAGVPVTDAKQLVTAYSINEAAQAQAVREDVMVGFGNNGGEEFMSFLMTGEGMLIKGGDNWKKWYDMMSVKLMGIQNPDGSWNGHHCITSPVFCTATCLLILSIHQDMQFSMQQHQK